MALPRIRELFVSICCRTKGPTSEQDHENFTALLSNGCGTGDTWEVNLEKSMERQGIQHLSALPKHWTVVEEVMWCQCGSKEVIVH